MYEIFQGKSEEVLCKLPSEKARCCVTSPPYWQLKDYGVDDQLGTEATPEAFVDNLRGIFSEVRRILTDDGTLWLNLGDSYCGGGGYCPNAPSNKAGSKQSSSHGTKAAKRPVPPGYKHKDLAGVPWLVAHALRQDGWYLRADIIWEKTNAFPEKVTDRPTRNHEYVFLFSKSRRYYYDHEAIMEESATGGVRNRRAVWRLARGSFRGAHFAVFPEKLVERCLLAGSAEGDLVLDPFSGAGTTGMVAQALKRDYWGIELNPEYCQIAEQRITGDA